MPYKSFVIGALEGDHVAVKVFGYEYPEIQEDAEASNWLCAEISVSAGVWGGRVRDAYISTRELAALREQVQRLASGDSQEANFEPMEPHLILKLATEGHGKIEVSGVAFDEPEGVNAIAFNWLMDPKQLKSLLHQLREIEGDYPPR
jgi:hypothetical protein